MNPSILILYGLDYNRYYKIIYEKCIGLRIGIGVVGRNVCAAGKGAEIGKETYFA